MQGTKSESMWACNIEEHPLLFPSEVWVLNDTGVHMVTHGDR